MLVPTDFSDNSFKALKYALLIIKDVRCTFYLLEKYMPPVYRSIGRDIYANNLFFSYLNETDNCHS